VFGRLAGYEDVNDAERLRHDPAMRWIVGGKAVHGRAELSAICSLDRATDSFTAEQVAIRVMAAVWLHPIVHGDHVV
jgi:hypothetical protein